MSKSPLVSVIITTRNEERNIGACLDSIRKQTYGSIEIIVVDNGSTDKTKIIAHEYTKSVYAKGPERSAQRNFGAKQADGEFLFFIDADMILSADVVESCVKAMERPAIQALIIPERSIGDGFWAKCKALERNYYIGLAWIEAARFFRTSAFTSIAGYDELLTGPEDFDIHQRIHDRFGALSIDRIKTFIEHNEGRLSFWRSLKKKFYYAQDLKQYAGKIANEGYYKKQSSIFARYAVFFSHPMRIIRNPSIGLGMLFLKTAEFAAGFLGFVYYSIRQSQRII